MKASRDEKRPDTPTKDRRRTHRKGIHSGRYRRRYRVRAFHNNRLESEAGLQGFDRRAPETVDKTP